MVESLQSQINKIKASIDSLEGQRTLLGDEAVNTALEVLRGKLAELEGQAASQAAPVEERRMVTILFTDIVGSTAMAEKMDPEEWRQVVAKIHTTLGDVISHHHGTVAQYLGDGLLAFFGSKVASEHDPENAIRAALDAQAALANLPLPEQVQLRLGIHTGLVVVGELGDAIHKEFTATGDAMNLAARLQSAAPPSGTLISHDTYRYVRGVFDLTPRPPLTVKGKGEPVQTYLVRRAKPRPFRTVARGVAGIETRTVGRDAEMQTLQQAYLRAFKDHGLVWAQLLGDPGVGKSRLLVDLSDWLDLRDENYRLLRARAFPDDVSQPFSLVRRMWFDRFQIAEDAPLEQAEAKWVERYKEFSGLEEVEEPAHALGLLVGLPFDASPHIKAMRNDPNQVKGRALVVCRELLNSVRRLYPIVLLLEDLQWTDRASWDFLVEVFLDEPSVEHNNGMFILGAARREWQPPEELSVLFDSSLSAGEMAARWGVSIELAPLSDQSTRELAREIFQLVEAVPDSVIDLLVERSEGVPYFTEEIVNWFIDHEILDSSTEPWCFMPDKLKAIPLPDTLQHLLLTRLSSLSQSERATLQRGAIFGRRFWTGGVEALGVTSGEETLAHLQPRGFVEVQPESSFQGDTEWSFHHNLLQEVTYESVLKRERAELHKVAASWLQRQARQAGRLDEFAGLLGDHCERAGELSEAADWYMLAGNRAFRQGAPHEAKGFYTQALALLPPVARERRWQALAGREDALKVLGDAELRKADIDALVELAKTFEDSNLLSDAYLRQAEFSRQAGDDVLGIQATQKALENARSCGNETIEARALALLAQLYSYQDDRSSTTQNITEALQLARRLGDETLLEEILYRAAYCSYNHAESQSIYNEQVELAHRLGNRSQEAIGLGNSGVGYLSVGLFKQARSLLEKSLAINKALGARRSAAYNLLNLGEVFMYAGDLRKARQLEEQALQEISPSQDLRAIPSILLMLGTILLEMGDVTGAVRRLTEALELSQSHGYAPKVCEAKAGLAACAIQQGHLEEARDDVRAAWDFLREANSVSGMGAPGKVFRNCVETFDALGDTESMRAALDYAYKGLMHYADQITIPEWRQSFLENMPDHRWLIELYERSQH